MNISDLGVLAEALGDLGQHLLLVGLTVLDDLLEILELPALRPLARQVVGLVAVNQVLDGRGVPALAPLPGRIASLVDVAAQLPGALARSIDRPVWIVADGGALLAALNAVVEHEGLRAAAVDPQAQALALRVPDDRGRGRAFHDCGRKLGRHEPPLFFESAKSQRAK